MKQITASVETYRSFSILQDIFVFFWHENFHRFYKALVEASSER